MVKSNVKILIKKHWKKIAIYGGALVLEIWLSLLLTPSFTKFNQYLVEKSVAPITRLIISIVSIFGIKVPVYSILLFVIIVRIIYNVSRAVMLSRREFKIIKAEYGSGTTFLDITDQLNDLVIDNNLNITLSNGIPGLDPTPGTVKLGKIKYQSGSQIVDRKYKEGDTVSLP